MELKDNTLILNEKDLAIQEAMKEESKFESVIKTDVDKVEGKTESKVQENASQSEYHIVKAGDTMYKISIQYHISLTKLLQLNNMQETDMIAIGQKIRVK